MRPEVGQIINGKYRLTRLIGEGGMGSVFEATHEYLGSAVALKFLNPGLASRQGLVARFLQEARVSASIRSPHVVHVSDVDQSAEGLPYLVMELLEGESLQQAMNQNPRLPLGVALEYAAQILNGLEVAHARNIVHRDLKPDNVFIVPTPNGPLLKLLDFGIAKLRSIAEVQPGLTRPGALMGTPEYMAPEQAFSADTVDHRADLYAAGVILFEMIAGRRPVEASEPQAMAALVMAGRVSRLIDLVPTVPQGLSDAVGRALCGRVEDRFSSAAEMRGAILPFFTASAQAAGVRNYPSVMAATPPVPPVHGTAVLSAPAAPQGPAPTQPGTDPDAPPTGVSPTLPPSESGEGGRTGTVLGDGAGPGLSIGSAATDLGGEYGATAEMPPMQFGPEAPVLTYSSPPRKKKSATWTIIGVLAGVLGALAAAAVIAFFVVDRNDSGEPTTLPTITPPTTVTAEPTAVATPTSLIGPPATTTATTPTTTSTVRPPTRDAGRDAGFGIPGLPDGGLAIPPFPDGGFALPPFPSSIPSGVIPPFTVPSGIPTIPIPGWPPPPSQ